MSVKSPLNIYGFDEALEFPFRGAMPSPDFSETQMWNFSDGQYGLLYHIGAMPGDMDLRHNAFSINCPDGSVLAAKVVGRGIPDAFGTATAHSKTVEPYSRWRIVFDGAMRRYHPSELSAGPARDGMHVAVKITLDIVGTHSAWEPGGHTEATVSDGIFNTMARMHHEQPVSAKGLIEIDGVQTSFEGIGHRDHSYGPRDMRRLRRDAWINATFESGWSFLGFWGELENDSAERSAIFADGKVIAGSMRQDALLNSTGPEPRQFEVTVRTDDGAVRVLKVKVTQYVNWFNAGLMEWCLGADTTEPTNYIWCMCFAEFECDGERGRGFVDRGVQASLLTLG